MTNSRVSAWRWHLPGRFYFGMSVDATQPAAGSSRHAEAAQSYGPHRTSFAWASRMATRQRINDDHANQRLPWVSLDAPEPGVEGWRAVAAGLHDHEIDALAQDLIAHVTLPAILTFGDDPSDAAYDSDGALWAAAFCRFHSIIDQSIGRRMIGAAPILGDWLFNPANNRQEPTNWLTAEVLERSDLLGVDMYENASGETFGRRVPRILDWLSEQGFDDLRIGVADSGRRDYAPPYVDAEAWLHESLGWVADHTDEVPIVCYSASTQAESRGVFWRPDQLPTLASDSDGWIHHAVTRF